jgi:hypothetical protein
MRLPYSQMHSARTQFDEKEYYRVCMFSNKSIWTGFLHLRAFRGNA